MKKINESWDPTTSDLREDNVFNGCLMNLSDADRVWPSEASSKARELFDELWDLMISEARDWEEANPTSDDETTSSSTKGGSSSSTSTGGIKSTTPVSVSPSHMITLLRNDIVKFQYEKKDGSIRTAFGTRNPSIIGSVIGSSAATSGTSRPSAPGFITYFDMDKKGFRKFSETRLIGVLDEHAKITTTPVVESTLLTFNDFNDVLEVVEE